MSPPVETYCFSIHKDGGALRTQHHHLQGTFKLGADALQTLAEKADCLVRYVSKLPLNGLWRKAYEKV